MPTNIQWSDETWNPTLGCRKISPGCDNCYAIPNSHRLAGNDNAKIQAAYAGLTQRANVGIDWTGTVKPMADRLSLPLKWIRPRRIFVNSMSDLFHEDVPDGFIFDVLFTIQRANWHVFQVLTKRPDKMKRVMQRFYELSPMPALPNLWLGVSVESQDYVWRIEKLLKVPAAVRFVSAEPLLGPLDLGRLMQCGYYCDGAVGHVDDHIPGLHWIIVGGESGRGARPCNIQWIREIQQQCQSVGIPVFVKQLGAVWAKNHSSASPKADFMNEWPEYLRVRQYPTIEVR
jgi:protein gp37